MVAVVMAAMVRSAAAPVSDTDVWWNLRVGELLSHHAPWSAAPRLSTFATSPWAPTEAIPDIVGARVEQWWELPGLAWLYGAALAALLVATYLALRRVADPVPAGLVTCLIVLAESQSLTPRPQIVSLALLPVVVVVWLRTADDLQPRWWLVPLSWLWSLCHGFWIVGAVIGLVVVSVLLLTRRARGRSARDLAALVVATVMVVALNPVGPRVLLAPFVVGARSAYIIEWLRTDLATPAPLVAVLTWSTVVLLMVRAQRYDAVRLSLLALSAFFIWYSTRTVSIGGVIAAVMLADALQRLVSREGGVGRAGRREVGALLAWSTVCLVALAAATPRTSGRVDSVPVAFDARLDRLPSGTVVFNNYEVGGWLAWRHPGLEHYVDPLADAYPVAHLQRYVEAINAEPGWQRIIHASGAQAAVLQQGVPLTAALEARGWQAEDSSRGYVLLMPPATGS